MKLSQVHKITLSALLLALTIILTRITPLQNFPIIPWIRISLGPSLIIFASLLLGPIYGAIVGAGSDILGIVLFPNSLGYGINPLITLVYGLLGVLPWILMFFVRKIKNENVLKITFISVAALVFLALISFVIFVPSYDLKIWHKILITSLSGGLFILLVVSLFLMNKYFKKRYGEIFSPFKLAFVCLICEFLLMLFLNSLVKTITFEVNYWVIFYAQLIVFFVDVPLNTFVVELLLLLTMKLKGNYLD